MKRIRRALIVLSLSTGIVAVSTTAAHAALSANHSRPTIE